MKKLIVVRRCSQIFFLMLFVYILWTTTYPLEGPLHPETFFKINPLISIFTSLSERVVLPGMAFSLFMVLLTLVLGRFFCGWICPLGTTIDGTGALRKKKAVLRDSTNKKVRVVKFFILGIIALSAVAGIQLAWIFDPMVIMARFVSLNFIPTVTLAVDKLFISIIQRMELYGPVYDFYRYLKSSFLGINVYYFSNSGLIFLVFLGIVLPNLLMSRVWCRMLCPLGALYGFISKISSLRRVVKECKECGLCKGHCRMGAIKDDTSYVKSECILCMDCIYNCPEHLTKFSLKNDKKR